MWEPDPWIWDDQGIICNVKGRGLVVVSSCSHSGVVNVLRNAQRITGVEKVHAFIGGLHLTGGLFEKIIPETVEELKKIRPDVIVPGHCTGWRAAHQISGALYPRPMSRQVSGPTCSSTEAPPRRLRSGGIDLVSGERVSGLKNAYARREPRFSRSRVLGQIFYGRW